MPGSTLSELPGYLAPWIPREVGQGLTGSLPEKDIGMAENKNDGKPRPSRDDRQKFNKDYRSDRRRESENPKE